MDLNIIKKTFEKDICRVDNKTNLDKIKLKYLGRGGLLNAQFKLIKNYSSVNKKQFGKLINALKSEILIRINDKFSKFNKDMSKENFDITLPGLEMSLGKRHIINETIDDIENFFSNLGFTLINGYEIDTVYYNFDALNMNCDHPSRDDHETFYINDELLLRTHTSNMQIHIMKNQSPPFRVISCGKVYRRDSDISHTPMFHQLEGFVIDKKISFCNLKYLLTMLLEFIFKKNIDIRIRPSYFPFTEPSAEVDIKCVNCSGKSCPTCKYSGWIEILGCGMVHPNVLNNCNINNKVYSGFAFGLGIERITMIKHNINDLRLFFENNIEFLNQF